MSREVATDDCEVAAGADELEVTSPLLLRGRFTSTSSGSMQWVGLRERKPTKVSEFEAQYRQKEEKTSVMQTVKATVSKKCSRLSLKRVLTSNFPILRTVKKYKPLQDLPSDLVAGITSGTMMISQGMAFASLSTLQPIIGLYISLFASITYFLFGTGQQSSFGCIAILSIMMGSILDKYETQLKQSTHGTNCGDPLATTLSSVLDNENVSSTTFDYSQSILNSTVTPLSNSNATSDALDLDFEKLQVAGAVSLLSGIIFAVLGKVGLGKVTIFISDSLVTGVTVGAAFHVGSSQLKTIFGLEFLPRQSGIFKLIKLWYSLLSHIHLSNPASIIASAVCILMIYLVKRFINEKYKDKLRVPIPIELIVMILATVVSYYASLNEKFGIGIIKDVPVGIPRPHIPDLSLGVDYLTDGLIIIIVAFVQSVSIAKLMGLKHKYTVDTNQEMFAVGMVNIVCAMFSGYISGASVSRSVVQDSAGGKSQIASLFAAILVLLVMLFVGQYFYYVPKCSLSAIVIVSLRSLMLKLLTIPDMWRKSKMDCLIFVTTVAAVVILDADIGLLVGIIVSVLLVLFQSLMSSVDVTTCVTVDGPCGLWRSKEKYGGEVDEEKRDIKVLRINNPLYFLNSEIVTNAIFKKTGLNPLKVKADESADNKSKRSGNVNTKSTGDTNGTKEVAVVSKIENVSAGVNHGAVIDDVDIERSKFPSLANGKSEQKKDTTNSDALPFTYLILDLSGVSFVDLMGVKALEFVIEKYQSVGVGVYLTNVTEKCLDALQRSGFMAKYGELVLLTLESVHAELLLKDHMSSAM